MRQPHEHVRNGTAKLSTLFYPVDGQLRIKGVTSTANAVQHPWLKAELSAVLAILPLVDMTASISNRAQWIPWQEGLMIRPILEAI